jgi:hypothetical protein
MLRYLVEDWSAAGWHALTRAWRAVSRLAGAIAANPVYAIRASPTVSHRQRRIDLERYRRRLLNHESPEAAGWHALKRAWRAGTDAHVGP